MEENNNLVQLQDENGKVTVESVVAYAENYIDTHELSDAVEERIEELLDTAEDAAEMAALASDAYAADLAALKLQIESIVSTVESTATPESITSMPYSAGM